MAISDKYLPGNLNQAEMDTVKGIPMEMFNRLSQEEKARILGLGSEERTVKGIPMEMFNKLSSEDQRQILGNLNRTEMDQLQGSEPGTGMSSEFRELIDRLIAMGVPREEVLKIIQSRMDAMTAEPLMSTAEGHFSGSPHSEGPFWNQYNQGGIVSLRHLTRPIGI